MSAWQDITTIPEKQRVLLWVTGNMLPGVWFGSAYRVDGKVIAKPEGGNGDWTDSITHWMPLPQPPAKGGGETR